MDRARDPRTRTRAALAARLRRLLRPPRTLRPTRAGWSFFALTFGVGFAALNTGNNLLYLVLSLMLAFLVLSGVLSESALRGIAVRRRVPRELYDGGDPSGRARDQQPPAARPRLRAGGGGPRARAQRRAASGRPRLRAADRARSATERRSYRFRPGQRGPFEFIGFRVSTRFPFGLFAKAMEIEAPEEALAYPAIERVPAPAEFGGARESGEQVRGPRGGGSDVGGLRDFAAGDPLRRIHWRASLRQRALLVREVESEHHAEVELRLRTVGVAPGEEFERRVRWVASEAVSLLDAGVAVALRTDHAQVAPARGERQRAVLLAFLARVEPGEPKAAEAA